MLGLLMKLTLMLFVVSQLAGMTAMADCVGVQQTNEMHHVGALSSDHGGDIRYLEAVNCTHQVCVELELSHSAVISELPLQKKLVGLIADDALITGMSPAEGRIDPDNLWVPPMLLNSLIDLKILLLI